MAKTVGRNRGDCIPKSQLCTSGGGGQTIDIKQSTFTAQDGYPDSLLLASEIIEFKARASIRGQSSSASKWISTQDAVFSLLWYSFITARRFCGRVTSAKDHDRLLHQKKTKSNYKGDELAGMAVVMDACHLLNPPLPPNYIWECTPVDCYPGSP